MTNIATALNSVADQIATGSVVLDIDTFDALGTPVGPTDPQATRFDVPGLIAREAFGQSEQATNDMEGAVQLASMVGKDLAVELLPQLNQLFGSMDAVYEAWNTDGDKEKREFLLYLKEHGTHSDEMVALLRTAALLS